MCLPVGPLSGVPVCSWLFPCVLVILHSHPLRSALCLSLPCPGLPKAGSLCVLWPPIWAQPGRPCGRCCFPPGQPWFGQLLFPTSASPLEPWSSCVLGDGFPLLLEPGCISIPCWLCEPCTSLKGCFPKRSSVGPLRAPSVSGRTLTEAPS